MTSNQTRANRLRLMLANAQEEIEALRKEGFKVDLDVDTLKVTITRPTVERL